MAFVIPAFFIALAAADEIGDRLSKRSEKRKRKKNSGTLYKPSRSTYSPHKSTETHVIDLPYNLNVTQKFHPETNSLGPSYEAIFGQREKSGSVPSFAKSEMANFNIMMQQMIKQQNALKEIENEKKLKEMKELNQRIRYPAYTAPSSYDSYGSPKPIEQVIRETVPAVHTHFPEPNSLPGSGLRPWEEPHLRALATDDHYAGLFNSGPSLSRYPDPRDWRNIDIRHINQARGQW
jgi:hypothetical protein